MSIKLDESLMITHIKKKRTSVYSLTRVKLNKLEYTMLVEFKRSILF
jgi:hypothetical protein